MSEFVQMEIAFNTKEHKAKLDASLLNVPELHITRANVVEAMTARKRTGIIFELTDGNGKTFFVKTSAQMIMNGLAPAARGFCHRVGDNPDLA